MNAYAMEQIARQRTAEVQDQARHQSADRNRPASRSPSVMNLTGWALIQVGLALVTSSARHQHTAAMSPELP